MSWCHDRVVTSIMCFSVVMSHPMLPTAAEYEKTEADELVHPSIYALERATDIQAALADMLK